MNALCCVRREWTDDKLFPPPHLPPSVEILIYYTGTCWLCWGRDSGQPRKVCFGWMFSNSGFLPTLCPGDGPIPFFVVGAACLFCCLFTLRTASHSPLSEVMGCLFLLWTVLGSLWSKHCSYTHRLQSSSLCASWEGTHCISVAGALQPWAQPHLCPLACLSCLLS